MSRNAVTKYPTFLYDFDPKIEKSLQGKTLESTVKGSSYFINYNKLQSFF